MTDQQRAAAQASVDAWDAANAGRPATARHRGGAGDVARARVALFFAKLDRRQGCQSD